MVQKYTDGRRRRGDTRARARVRFNTGRFEYTLRGGRTDTVRRDYRRRPVVLPRRPVDNRMPPEFFRGRPGMRRESCRRRRRRRSRDHTRVLTAAAGREKFTSPRDENIHGK